MKLSIIAEGGAARGAYVVGVLNALYHHFGLENVDYLAGSSAGIGVLSYYAAGQFDDCYYIWTNELSSDKVLSFKNIFRGRSFGDAYYIIDEIVKKRVPLDENKVKIAKMHLIVPLTNFKTGKVEYFDNKSHFDIFEILKAAIVTPFIYGKPVKLGNNLYCDGVFSDPVPIDHPTIKKSKKIIILTKTEKQSKSGNVTKILSVLLKWKLGSVASESLKNMHTLYQKRMRQIKLLESKGDIVIRPKKGIKIFDNRSEALMAGIEQGYKDTISNRKLLEFIKSLKKSNRNYFK